MPLRRAGLPVIALMTAGLLASDPAAAFLQTDFDAAGDGEEGWKTEGEVTAGLDYRRGNTDIDRYTAFAEARARSRRNRLIGGAELNYGRTDGERDVDNRRGFGRYDRFLGERLYFNTNVSLLRDRFRDLRLRTSAGVGLGYQFLDRATVQLSAEAGINYLREDRFEAEDEEEPAWRWAADYRQKFFDGAMTVFHRQEGLVDATDSSDWLITTRSGVRTPVAMGIAASLQVHYDYENQVPEGRKRYDSAVLVALSYEW